ncbi:hypothetical protein AOLI_G00128660 [Acnodon oligacanthus]
MMLEVSFQGLQRTSRQSTFWLRPYALSKNLDHLGVPECWFGNHWIRKPGAVALIENCVYKYSFHPYKTSAVLLSEERPRLSMPVDAALEAVLL